MKAPKAREAQVTEMVIGCQVLWVIIHGSVREDYLVKHRELA